MIEKTLKIQIVRLQNLAGSLCQFLNVIEMSFLRQPSTTGSLSVNFLRCGKVLLNNYTNIFGNNGISFMVFGNVDDLALQICDKARRKNCSLTYEQGAKKVLSQTQRYKPLHRKLRNISVCN